MEKEIVDRLIFKSGMTAKDYKFEQEIPKRPNPLKLSKWLSKETLICFTFLDIDFISKLRYSKDAESGKRPADT